MNLTPYNIHACRTICRRSTHTSDGLVWTGRGNVLNRTSSAKLATVVVALAALGFAIMEILG